MTTTGSAPGRSSTPTASTSLGLSIVRTLVESELGGQFEIGPGPDGGTRRPSTPVEQWRTEGPGPVTGAPGDRLGRSGRGLRRVRTRARALRRLSARRSSSLMPPQTPWSCPASRAHCEALFAHLAPTAHLLRLLDLEDGRTGVADREEQLRVLVEARGAVAPIHGWRLLSCGVMNGLPGHGSGLLGATDVCARTCPMTGRQGRPPGKRRHRLDGGNTTAPRQPPSQVTWSQRPLNGRLRLRGPEPSALVEPPARPFAPAVAPAPLVVAGRGRRARRLWRRRTFTLTLAGPRDGRDHGRSSSWSYGAVDRRLRRVLAPAQRPGHAAPWCSPS